MAHITDLAAQLTDFKAFYRGFLTAHRAGFAVNFNEFPGAAEIAELASQVVAAAKEKNLRFAAAESLTGGMLAAAIVAVPGASQVFTGGVVAYDTAVKKQLLGVASVRLTRTGPVDAVVAAQMACGLEALGASFELAVATTGVAGPDADPQTGQKPGVFYVGGFSRRCLESPSFFDVTYGNVKQLRDVADGDVFVDPQAAEAVENVYSVYRAAAESCFARGFQVQGQRDEVRAAATFVALAALQALIADFPA